MMPFSFSAIRSAFVSYFYSFKESFLYYPVLFAVGGFALFMITSRLDEIYGSSFYDDNNVIVSYLEPIFFAGSPHAARSVLSTIAAGWATILGVAFSVTLITLQLSVTKYTAEIINEFQNSRINQLTLAMFILVVIFSLLVLKTVRTGEDGSSTFAPILGVNISVYLAAIVLFVFVVFLHNISSYLKPDSLINRIVRNVLRSMKKYEKRTPDRQFRLGMQNMNEHKVLSKIKSPREGIIRSIDWEKISDVFGKQSNLEELKNQQPGLFLKWLSVIGDHVEKGQVISKLYSTDDVRFNPAQDDEKTLEQLVQDAVFAGLDIGPARRISSDPRYGLEILRNIAVRAISQSDIGVASSCISGLLRIFHNIAKLKNSTAVPFMVPTGSTTGRHVATISTGEGDLEKETLALLSNIYHISSASDGCKVSVAGHFARNYTSLGKLLLDENNIEGFERLTGWYSAQSSAIAASYSKELRSELEGVLARFKKDVEAAHPYAKDAVRIHLRGVFVAEA